MASSYDRLRPPSEKVLRVETLLRRYPNLSEQEIAQLINLYPTLNMLDQSLLTVDDRLAPKLGEFHREHGSKLKRPLAALIAFFAIPLLVTSFGLWWIFT